MDDFISSFFVPASAPRAPQARKLANAGLLARQSALDGPAGTATVSERKEGSTGSEDNFQVFVRVRTQLSLDRDAAGVTVEPCGQRVKLASSTDRQFRFHAALGPTASQEDVYDRAVRRCTEWVLEGYNSTVFAYGQTGSGKTYTMVGDERHWRSSGYSGSPHASDGVMPRVVADIFAASEGRGRAGVRVFVSAAQIYRETVTDLLHRGTGPARPLELREHGPDGSSSGSAASHVYVDGLSRVRVRSAREAMLLFLSAAGRRETASTRCNEVSSRSHAVFTLHLEQDSKDGSGVTLSHLNLVDLAGSERISVSGATGERRDEAIAINCSLLALAGVITALTEEQGGTRRAHIPYRDSKLTRLLQDSLGGNCRTAMLATVAPSIEAEPESARTLRFACRATYVKNQARVNKMVMVDGRLVKATPVPPPDTKFSDEEARWLEERRLAMEAASLGEGKEAAFFNDYVFVPFHGQEIAVQAHGRHRSSGPVAVCLHGFGTGASSEGWDYMIDPLVDLGYRVIGIDFPGFGRSKGERLSHRSEHNCAAKGPVEIVLAVLDHFGVRRAAMLGYDWGGGIAWSVAAKSPKRVSCVVAFHATYTIDSARPELPRVRCPNLVLWSPPDQFHPVAWAKKFAKQLKKVDLQVLKHARNASWRDEERALTAAMIDWLKVKGPKVKPARRTECKESKERTGDTDPTTAAPAASTTGTDRAAHASTAGAGGGAGAGSARLASRDMMSPEQVAVQEFRAHYAAGELPAMYGVLLGRGDQSRKPDIIRLFSSLPVLEPRTLACPDRLVETGLWSRAPTGWGRMHTSPRYLPGRRVLVRLRGVQSCCGGPSFMAARRAAGRSGGEAYVTHRAWLKGRRGAVFDIVVDAADGGTAVPVEVPSAELFALNQRHRFLSPAEANPQGSGSPPRFKSRTSHVLQFEDAVKCDYASLLMRARMAEVALALEELVSDLDFTADGPDAVASTLAVQKKCVHRLLQVLNISRLQDGVDRRRERRSLDVARLITYGQGHCHTLSGTTAAVLHAFGPCLGVDVAYRSGDVVGDGCEPTNVVDRHHWLELHMRPSMAMVVCDPSSDEVGDAKAVDGSRRGRRWLEAAGTSALYTPVEVAYGSACGLYPQLKPLKFCETVAVAPSDMACE